MVLFELGEKSLTFSYPFIMGFGTFLIYLFMILLEEGFMDENRKRVQHPLFYSFSKHVVELLCILIFFIQKSTNKHIYNSTTSNESVVISKIKIEYLPGKNKKTMFFNY